jgi:hypothetical protein
MFNRITIIEIKTLKIIILKIKIIIIKYLYFFNFIIV